MAVENGHNEDVDTNDFATNLIFIFFKLSTEG